jgi:hypothetical protein
MAAGGHKLLGALEAPGQLPRLLGGESLLELREVLFLLAPDVLAQVGEELVEGGQEVRVPRREGLELVQLLFGLRSEV